MKTLPNRFVAAGRAYRILERAGCHVMLERNRNGTVDFVVTQVYNKKGHERLPGVFLWGKSAWAAGTIEDGNRILTENS